LTVTLSDNDSSTTLTLDQAQELSNEWSSAVEASAFMGQSAEDTFLSSFAHEGRVALSGTTHGQELSQRADYSSDPLFALAEWALQFEAFVNGGQGSGYAIERGYRSDKLTEGVLESVQWTWSGGDPYTLEWSLSYLRGKNAGPTNSVTPGGVGAASDYTANGEKLPNIEEVTLEKSQSYEMFRRAFAENPEDNDIMSVEGPVRRIDVVGEITGTVTERNDFDDYITQYIGQDTTVTLEDQLTGRDFDVMIDGYEPTDQAGLTRVSEYQLSMVEGLPTD